MNNDMMPLVLFLLLSEDLKKQGDRIIQQVLAGQDGGTDVTAILKGIADLKVSVEKLERKVDCIADCKDPCDKPASTPLQEEPATVQTN